jgi:hypothetical protein
VIYGGRKRNMNSTNQEPVEEEKVIPMMKRKALDQIPLGPDWLSALSDGTDFVVSYATNYSEYTQTFLPFYTKNYRKGTVISLTKHWEGKEWETWVDPEGFSNMFKLREVIYNPNDTDIGTI